MEIIDIIFALLKKFVPMESSQHRELKTDAMAWRSLVNKEDKIWVMYDKVHEQWYMRLLFAVMYIPATRWVLSFMEAEHEDIEL